MASKTYQLNIAKSDGTNETVSFAIPDTAGTYTVKFTLSDGQEIDAGNITIDDAEHSYDLKLTLSDGSTINAGTIITPIAVSNFVKLSWAEIAEISEAGNAMDYFAVGDEKTIELSTGEQITLVILGFNHDDLSDGSGKAGITIGMKNLLKKNYRMNAGGTNTGGWEGSEMRTSTMATLFSQLPPDLQSVIKQVNKKATQGNKSSMMITSSDKLFLFSEVEIDGTTSAPYKNEGTQYEYWKTVKDGTVAADRILSNSSGTRYLYWLRSPYIDGSYYFQSIDAAGNISHSRVGYTYGVCFNFCV